MPTIEDVIIKSIVLCVLILVASFAVVVAVESYVYIVKTLAGM